MIRRVRDLRLSLPFSAAYQRHDVFMTLMESIIKVDKAVSRVHFHDKLVMGSGLLGGFNVACGWMVDPFTW
ncbi:hypothetical protein O9992_24835 [Vibrio lentus]|nr:hypothetical protein [Vibrio lentus]